MRIIDSQPNGTQWVRGQRYGGRLTSKNDLVPIFFLEGATKEPGASPNILPRWACPWTLNCCIGRNLPRLVCPWTAALVGASLSVRALELLHWQTGGGAPEMCWLTGGSAPEMLRGPTCGSAPEMLRGLTGGLPLKCCVYRLVGVSLKCCVGRLVGCPWNVALADWWDSRC